MSDPSEGEICTFGFATAPLPGSSGVALGGPDRVEPPLYEAWRAPPGDFPRSWFQVEAVDQAWLAGTPIATSATFARAIRSDSNLARALGRAADQIGMATKLTSPTQSLKDAKGGLKVVDGIMSYMSDSQGKPTNEQRALYVATVAFAYAVWESYIEDLAIEVVTYLSDTVEPSAVPDGIPDRIAADATNWELNVHPGWRQLWIDQTRLRAKGDEESKHGLSMATTRAVIHLIEWVGVDPFAGQHPSCPRLDDLARLRNQVVHTGKIPDDLRKKDVIEWRAFVQKVCTSADKACAGQATAIAIA